MATLSGVLIGGCLTVNNTVAQDLAHDRLARCRRFPSVMLRSLAPDGSMIVVLSGVAAVSEYPAWRDCMDEALAEQRQQGKLPSGAQPTIVAVTENR